MAAMVMRTHAIVVVASIFCVLTPSHGASFLRAGQVNERDADFALSTELEESHAGRVAAFEDALRSMYAALPKNEHGHLSHQAVRYALHRLFVQRHGWYVKGLDPNGAGDTGPAAGNSSEKDWVPSYLQAALEARSGGPGAGLRQLAALAAALEDLVRKEAVGRLAAFYKVLRMDTAGSVGRKQAEDVMFTNFLSFLVANKLSAASPEEIHRKQKLFVSKYKDWESAHDWFEANIMENSTAPDGNFDFNTTSNMAIALNEKYHTFNDLECKSLKSSLLQLEDRKAGRVQLSAFYNRSMHSHWKFTEKAEYLKSIGALDESNATRPMVIVPNYVMGRMNCLESSGIYSLCCRNECEDLLGKLERDIGAPDAPPELVAQLVVDLPSDTVPVPRALPDALRSRLFEVATGNGGRVPLHSRLFAQWMHHAYPRECPYPHEPGAAGPQAPNEWMEETGQESNTASEEEMQRLMESCPVAEGDSAELPWTAADVHFAAPQPAGPAAEAASAAAPRVSRAPGGRSWALAAVALIVAAGALWMNYRSRELAGSRRRGVLDGEPEEAFWQWPGRQARVTLSLVGAALLLIAFELLDYTVLVMAAAAGFATLAGRAAIASTPWRPGPKKCVA